MGTISDAVGRRWFMIAGQCLGVIGSIMSATANNVNTLVGGSVFMGLAASSQVLFTILAQEIVPNKYRGYAQGSCLLFIFPAIGCGPIIGRSFVARFGTSMGWRYVDHVLMRLVSTNDFAELYSGRTERSLFLLESFSSYVISLPATRSFSEASLDGTRSNKSTISALASTLLV